MEGGTITTPPPPLLPRQKKGDLERVTVVNSSGDLLMLASRRFIVLEVMEGVVEGVRYPERVVEGGQYRHIKSLNIC